MANIELRDYIAEIEQMLAAENNLEAVAHCRHILNYYPKNLAVYRLLGKGLLEQRQFDDAANVFYRVLSATPDDFVAHLGLAIIGEEEGKLSQSIGHMARAFETQPNNAAIQDELKRLYGRRDGVAPNRIRLTRGGLARLYLNGGNYAQAVEELRVALKESPDRIDLQILLAKALWYDEQRIDAVQVCQGILQHLPYSLEANAILYEIWQSTDREEEATLYRQRVEALDPFLALELGGRPAGRAPKLEVPRLDYVPTAPEEMMGVPEWVKDLGLSFDEEEEGVQLEKAASPFDVAAEEGSEAVPDWLRDMVPSAGNGEPPESGRDWAAEKQLEEAVPGWLRDAGLLEEDEGAPVIEFDEPADEAPQADEPLPNWLADAVEWESKKKEAPEEAEGVPEDDWLLELDTEESDHGHEEMVAETDQWGPGHEAGTSGFGDLSWDELEDQLEAGGGESPSEPPEELTAEDEFPFDWKDWESEEIESSIESSEPEIESGILEESAMPQSNKDEFRTPGEGDELGEMPSDPEEAMKWLERLAASQGAPLEELPSLRGEELPPAEDMPDWLKEIAATSGYSPGEAKEEADEEELALPDWLREDAFTPGRARPSRPSGSDVVDDEVDLPDWLKEEFGEAEEPEPSAAAQRAETLPKDTDEAMAWLEELTLSSEEKEAVEPLDEPEVPDWLKEELVEEGGPAARPHLEATDQAELQDEEMPEDIDEAMAWLESLAARQGAPLDELTTYKGDKVPDVDLPDWLKAEYETAEAQPEATLEPEAEEELPEWLREEAEEPVAAAELKAPEIPDWLEETATPAAEEEKAVPVDYEFELPEWLRETVGEPAVEEAVTAEEHVEATEEELELPDWLRDQAAEEVVEEAEAVELPADEEEISLPEWLSEAVWEESVELAEAEEIEPALVEEEVELPEWLRDASLEEPVEAAEAELVAAIEDEELELPEWLHEEVPEAAVVSEEAEELLEEELLLLEEEEALEVEVEVETSEVEALEEAADEKEALVGVAAFREQLAEAPTDHVTRLALARALVDDEVLDQALSHYDELISASQELEEVIEDLDQLLESQPRNTIARRLLGDAYMKQGNLAEALEAYRQALGSL